MTQTELESESGMATAASFRKLGAGVSLKPQHFGEAAACDRPGVWFEVHPENYMMAGGPRLAGLEQVAARHPISFHGVGASLGGPDLPSADHMARIAQLMRRVEPAVVSEHAVWSTHAGTYFADLLPLPRTSVALAALVRGVDSFQSGIGRRILLENPSNYLAVRSEMDEVDFLLEVARRSGCGLLLDVNNLYLSARNVGIDPHAYIRAIPPALVGEIHIAGYQADPQFGDRLLIDSHDSGVAAGVWQLLDFALAHLGHTPVLLERDANIPPFETLLEESSRANLALQKVRAISGADNHDRMLA